MIAFENVSPMIDRIRKNVEFRRDERKADFNQDKKAVAVAGTAWDNSPW
jgi:hypothetical protein